MRDVRSILLHNVLYSISYSIQYVRTRTHTNTTHIRRQTSLVSITLYLFQFFGTKVLKFYEIHFKMSVAYRYSIYVPYTGTSTHFALIRVNLQRRAKNLERIYCASQHIYFSKLSLLVRVPALLCTRIMYRTMVTIWNFQ